MDAGGIEAGLKASIAWCRTESAGDLGAFPWGAGRADLVNQKPADALVCRRWQWSGRALLGILGVMRIRVFLSGGLVLGIGHVIPSTCDCAIFPEKIADQWTGTDGELSDIVKTKAP